MARRIPPSFDFYPDDFIAGTVDMNVFEVGMYVRFLCYQWNNGSLPGKDQNLMRISNLSADEFAQHWPAVRRKFRKNRHGNWVNPRLQVERRKAFKLRQQRAKAGRKGGSSKARNLLQQNNKPKHGKGKREVGSNNYKKDVSEIEQVVAYYRTHHPRARPGDKERSKIRERLAEGYSVDDLKSAIDGCHKSPHHCGQNETGTKYQTLELIVRDSSHVQKFIELNTPAAPTESQKLVRGDALSKAELRREVIRAQVIRETGERDEQKLQELVARRLNG